MTEYTAATSNATNKVTAEAENAGDTVTITVNDVEIDSGDSAEWESGENEVVITVEDPAGASETYAVTVTYTPAQA